MSEDLEFEISNIPGVPDYSINEFNCESSKFALIIPVLNEGTKFLNQIERIRERYPNLDIVVADGQSTDGSTDIDLLRQLGIRALVTRIGPGKLSAQLRMAIHYTLIRGQYAGVITMDGNGKDDVGGIAAIELALTDGFDYVQGSRFLKEGVAVNTPVLRLLAIRLFHAPVTSIASGVWITDSTNGFRGFSRKFLKDERVDPLRTVFSTYELLAYLPIRAGRLGFRFKEVPVTRRYPKNQPIPTKITGIKPHLNLTAILIKSAIGRYNPKSRRQYLPIATNIQDKESD